MNVNHLNNINRKYNNFITPIGHIIIHVQVSDNSIKKLLMAPKTNSGHEDQRLLAKVSPSREPGWACGSSDAQV